MRKQKTAFMLAVAAVLSLLVFLAPSVALAAQSGDFVYQVTGNTVTITGYKGHGGAVTVPAMIDGKKVTGIGDGAFMDCEGITGITSIALPDSITTIGECAFWYCTKLMNLTLPDSITSIGQQAFDHCTSLVSVVLPNHIKEVPNGAFMSCEKLKEVDIPESVTSINEDAFYFCYSLTTVKIPNSVNNIGFCAFNSCTSLKSITLPASVQTIDDYAFEYCSNMIAFHVDPANKKYSSKDGALFDKENGILLYYPLGVKGSYTIPNGTSEIGSDAFNECKGLTKITIPGSVTQIDGYAFENCTELSSVVFSEGLQGIGYEAFGGCTKLKSVTLPTSVNEIRSGAFGGCKNLTSIKVRALGGYFSSFNGVLYGYGMSELVMYPEGKRGAFTIPFVVNTIDEGAFGGCEYLTSISIPISVTYIGDRAFSGCSGLTSVTIPNQVTEIGEFAFSQCINLKTISLPKSVTKIGTRAFECAIDGVNFENDIPNCGSLVSINVDFANKMFSSRDGVLYDKSQSTLIHYPTGKKGSFTMPEGVKNIRDWAFTYSTGLTSISFPSSLTQIGQYAFMSCIKLKSVTFPQNVLSVEHGAFYDCTTLSKAIFQGAQPKTTSDAFGSNAKGFTVYYPITKASSWASFNGKYINKQAYCIATLYPQNNSPATKVMANVTKEHIAAPTAPTRKGYAFGGWYKEAACTHPWNFATDIVIGDIALFAKWVAPAPSPVTAASASYNSIQLTWKAVGIANGYEVYRSVTSTGKYALAGTINTASFTDKGLTTGSTYYYKVRSYILSSSIKSYGPWSVVISATPVPAAPAKINVKKLTAASASVNWSAVSGATKYEVWRCQTASDGKYTLLKTTASLSYTNTGIAAGQKYFYKVRAYRLVNSKKIYGAWSSIIAFVQ